VKIGCWIARSVIVLVSTRLMGVPNFREGMASLILGNFRMMALPCYVAASAQSGSTSLATTWRIVKRDAPSVTGTRKSLSAATVRAVASRMAGRSSMARHLHPSTPVEPPVPTTTKHLALLDKPLTAKTILILIPDRHTNNTRQLRSRIINPSNADSRRPIHRRTCRRCLKHQHTRKHTTARTALLPS
jgi:hypothetical protein